jgi:hypothetical protein
MDAGWSRVRGDRGGAAGYRRYKRVSTDWFLLLRLVGEAWLPLVWTKTADQILTKANRKKTSDAGHYCLAYLGGSAGAADGHNPVVVA